MKVRYMSGRRGYTVVEVMMTIVIVAVLSAMVGASYARLLTIQENEREEAYVREKLSDICASYADFVSVGSYISANTNPAIQAVNVKYRDEAGGVSLETGVVTRVSSLSTLVNSMRETMDLDIYSFELQGLDQKYSRTANGDAPLMPVLAGIVGCKIEPLNATESSTRAGYETTDAVLGYLTVTARYEVKNEHGEKEPRTVTAERVVRLWNR